MTEPKLIPEQFVIQSNSIASYDYVEIAEGTGIVEFNAFTTDAGTDGSHNYHLSRFTLDPGQTSTDPTNSHRYSYIGTSSNAKTFLLSPFNKPQTLKGTGYVQMTITTSNQGNGDSATPVVEIYKNSTLLVTATGKTILTVSAIRTIALSFTIPQTHFAIGDQLKVKIYCNLSGARRPFLWHDPINRDVTGFTPQGSLGTLPAVTASENPTQLKVFIPFRLDETG